LPHGRLAADFAPKQLHQGNRRHFVWLPQAFGLCGLGRSPEARSE
jgi:hypothetical protein